MRKDIPIPVASFYKIAGYPGGHHREYFNRFPWNGKFIPGDFLVVRMVITSSVTLRGIAIGRKS